MSSPDRRRFARVAWVSLAFTLLVILWGAFVRVTGSGAGCGSHWPTCHGQIVPRAPTVATLIELTHRVTSGLALVFVVAVLVLAVRTYPPGHFARRMAGASLFFMITEALVGAGLVLFEKVADDASLGRGAWMGAHLVNTFLLIGAMGLTAYGAPRDEAPRPLGDKRLAAWLGAALLAMLFVGVSGAIAALGDTLFPAATLREGLAQDVAHDAHPFVRLRALHPFVAVGTSLLLLWLSGTLARAPRPQTRRLAGWLAGLVVLQVAVGVVNLLLAAPAALQLAHLLVADALWITLVCLGASATSGAPSEAASGPSPVTAGA